MSIQLTTPKVNTIELISPSNVQKIFIDRKHYYESLSNLLQEHCVVYQRHQEQGVVFYLRDYGVCDIKKIGFTVLIESNGQEYVFQGVCPFGIYIDENKLQIHISGFPIMPISKCRLKIDWIIYAKILEQYENIQRKNILEDFHRPTLSDRERMRKINALMSRQIKEEERISCQWKNNIIPEEKIIAWKEYDELINDFSNLITVTQYEKSIERVPNFERLVDAEAGEVLLVPINCYFDKGFYSTIYYARNYPIVEKRLSGGKSSLQCLVCVPCTHLDLLMYLYYCTVDQRSYYQYMTDEQVELQQYLECHHPIKKLEKQVRLLIEKYHHADIVCESDVIQGAYTVIKDYYSKLDVIRDCAYKKLVHQKMTHGKWVGEYRLFIIVKAIFSDAIFQYAPEWLGQQTLDIYIPSINCAIEYQGEQHYSSVEYFGGDAKLNEQVARDKTKRDKCIEQGVALFQWPHTWKIHLNTLKMLLQGAVPGSYFAEERINEQISNFPIEKIEDLFHSPSVTTKTKKVKEPLPQTHEIRQYDVNGKHINSFENVRIAAETTGLSVGGISKVIYGERKTAGGYVWKRCLKSTPK